MDLWYIYLSRIEKQKPIVTKKTAKKQQHHRRATVSILNFLWKMQ